MKNIVKNVAIFGLGSDQIYGIKKLKNFSYSDLMIIISVLEEDTLINLFAKI